MAELIGHEAALFFPTATMPNKAALRVLSRPGCKVVAEEGTHVLIWEWGGPAIHSGLVMQGLVAKAGRPTPSEIEELDAFGPGNVVVLHNAHNSLGGRIWPLDEFATVADAARSRGAALHLDGARLFNAAVAAGLEPAAWGGLADTVAVCFSKGLGCPFGAVLAGSEETIEKAWEAKFLFGGALRQSGIAAAAMLYALDHNVERFAGDHVRAKRLGAVIWESAIGVADVEGGVEATPDTQYRVGSITKTFTAAAIMQLRDAGKLDLEDALDKHVEGAPHAPTIRRLLSHVSGLQRETQDDSWLTLHFAPADELLETLAQAEMVLPSGARFHYSNLAFALLGIVVERVSGVAYVNYVRQRLFEPLGLTRVGFEPEPPAARGYLGQPYADGVWDTIDVETGAWASAGQLWGTVGDLCRWGAFLADPDEAVLAKETAEEMRTVQVIAEHDRWLGGYGLGLGLRRDGERILVGHTGSMPGFIAVLYVSPKEKIGTAGVTNESEGNNVARRL